MEVVASLSQGRTAAAQCGLFTHKSAPVIFEPPCITIRSDAIPHLNSIIENLCDVRITSDWRKKIHCHVQLNSFLNTRTL